MIKLSSHKLIFLSNDTNIAVLSTPPLQNNAILRCSLIDFSMHLSAIISHISLISSEDLLKITGTGGGVFHIPVIIFIKYW